MNHFRKTLCLVLVAAWAPVVASADTTLLTDQRWVQYRHVDGSVFQFEAAFGGDFTVINLNNQVFVEDYVNSVYPEWVYDLTGSASALHLSSLDIDEQGGVNLSVLAGVSLHTNTTSLSDPTARGDAGAIIELSFDEPQRYELRFDAYVGGDESKVIGQFLNERFDVYISGANYVFDVEVDGQDLNLETHYGPWSPFFSDDFYGDVGIHQNEELRFFGVIEPGIYRFSLEALAPTDADDPGASPAGFLEFISTPIADLIGDANRDETVGQSDLDTVLQNWGQTGVARALGDLDGSGQVEQGDLDAVLQNGATQAWRQAFRASTCRSRCRC